MKYDTIVLDGNEVQFRIVPKNNKNTYFKFRKDGSIEITKSRYQSKKDVIKYMKENAVQFASKLNKLRIVPTLREGYYCYFGDELKILLQDTKQVTVNVQNNSISIPSVELDPDGKRLKKAEREIVLNEVKRIKEKYINNRFVDINEINIKTRHTKTRFGSCNAKRKAINLNANLIHYDRRFLEYVFLHEISHLKHQDHGKEFYQLLENLCPNYKQLRKELREIYR